MTGGVDIVDSAENNQDAREECLMKLLGQNEDVVV